METDVAICITFAIGNEKGNKLKFKSSAQAFGEDLKIYLTKSDDKNQVGDSNAFRRSNQRNRNERRESIRNGKASVPFYHFSKEYNQSEGTSLNSMGI